MQPKPIIYIAPKPPVATLKQKVTKNTPKTTKKTK